MNASGGGQGGSGQERWADFMNQNATGLYDGSADGERTIVRKVAGSAATSTLSIRDLSGKILCDVEYGGTTWSWKKDDVYREGLLLASQARDLGLRHYHLDHLGSLRLVTDRTGERVALFHYRPYGQEVVSSAQNPIERLRFTGHERDLGAATTAGDDLDYMHAHHYAPILARFTSIDLLRGNARRPQSRNLFAYADNNPVNAVDLFGPSAPAPTPTLGPPAPAEKPCDGSEGPCQPKTSPPKDPKRRKAPPADLATLKECIANPVGCVRRLFAGFAGPMLIEPDALGPMGQAMEDAEKVTMVLSGPGRVPKKSAPNSIYEERNPDETVRSRLFYNAEGQRISHQDFDHLHDQLGWHEHRLEYGGSGPVATSIVFLPPRYDNEPTDP